MQGLFLAPGGLLMDIINRDGRRGWAVLRKLTGLQVMPSDGHLQMASPGGRMPPRGQSQNTGQDHARANKAM